MQDHYGKHRQEPVWHPAGRLRQGVVPAGLRDWLLDGRSLTRRLKLACGDFNVQVLGEQVTAPMLNEARTLGMAPRQLARVRQVLLRCGDTPWVFARTIIPLSTLSGAERRLTRLGSRPLGEVLFATRGMRRSPIEVSVLDRRHRSYTMACDDCAEPIWGRRSVFLLAGKPLLVGETFLPAFRRALGLA